MGIDGSDFAEIKLCIYTFCEGVEGSLQIIHGNLIIEGIKGENRGTVWSCKNVSEYIPMVNCNI